MNQAIQKLRLHVSGEKNTGFSEADAAAAERVESELAATHQLFAEELTADLVARQRAWTVSHQQDATIGDVVARAEQARSDFDVLVTIGVGGSDLSARLFHDVLNGPYHNFTRRVAGGPPEAYFTGDTFDPTGLERLLSMLCQRGLLGRTLFNVISKSGTTGETISTLMVLRDYLNAKLPCTGPTWNEYVLATTGIGDGSALYRLHQSAPFYGGEPLPIPDGVGGRFSAFSPVGLFFLAATVGGEEPPGSRVDRLLEGVAQAHARFCLPHDSPDNIAYRLAGWLHAMEDAGKSALVFYNYADNRFLGEWFVQLAAESIQERGAGMDVLAARGPTSNHSLYNGILNGPRNKAVLFVRWEDLGSDLTIPTGTQIGGRFPCFEGLPMAEAQEASYEGTAEDLTHHGIPNATLVAPARDARSLGELMRTLMDAVAVKGRLQGLHLDEDGVLDLEGEPTYRQDAVEGYKRRTEDRSEARARP